MDRKLTDGMRKEVIANFNVKGTYVSDIAYGSGHINDTFLVEFREQEKLHLYILQRINHEIFKKPEQLIENIVGVTSYLRKEIIQNGGDPERETLNLIPSKSGRMFHQDESGNYWRMYQFITDATCFDEVKKPDDFYQSAVAFGHFQRMLAKYPAETLHETIAGFHDTEERLQTFKKAVNKDNYGRAAAATEEIRFVLERESEVSVLNRMIRNKELPIRVTHNDTKLNNIMIDNKTGRGICVIDLDTVMPGLAINDFGDSIRFGASTGSEDEVNLDKVSCDMSLFELYTRGFIEGCEGTLTKKEIKMLPFGARIMTYECGMRFLTDYLEGDAYFKIHREHHNLERARTQFKLVADMESKWDMMNEIVNRYKN